MTFTSYMLKPIMKTFNYPQTMRSRSSASAAVEPTSVTGLFAEHLRQPQNVIQLPLLRKPTERASHPENLVAYQIHTCRQTQYWDSLIFGVPASCAAAGIATAILETAALVP